MIILFRVTFTKSLCAMKIIFLNLRQLVFPNFLMNMKDPVTFRANTEIKKSLAEHLFSSTNDTENEKKNEIK